MIDHLDNLLRHLFMTQIAGLTDETRVRFQPPDEAWRTEVTNLQQTALNIYLADLRENRKLRSNERVRSIENSIVSEEPAPARVDCHYLITAWSPAIVTPTIEPTLDEHILLYQVLATLMNNMPLNPSRIYPPDSPLLDPDNPNAVSGLIREADLPTQLVPVEGFSKLAEFWGTMGVTHRWKPTVYLVVTLPVALQKEIAGPMVTTRIIEYRLSGKPGTAEAWIQIGGYVLDMTDLQDDGSPIEVVGAWVRLEAPIGTPLRTTTTDTDGRFTFAGLQEDNYTLRVRAQGFAEATRNIQVPSPTGNYDVELS
ncbi:MAG: Pvc16 family protein [Dehalococcoidia bacterium]